MTIGTPYALGNGHTSFELTGGSQTFTLITSTSNAVSSGNTIAGWIALENVSGVGSIFAVTDSASNTYTIGTAKTVGSFTLCPVYCLSASALGAGGTISVTLRWFFGTYNGAMQIGFMGCSGLTGFDLHGAGASGTSTTPSITISGQAVANEWLFPVVVTISSTVTKTEASGFTAGPLDHYSAQGTSLFTAYDVVAATSPVTYNPTLSTSVGWSTNYVTFQAGSAPPPPGNTTGAFFQFMRR